MYKYILAGRYGNKLCNNVSTNLFLFKQETILSSITNNVRTIHITIDIDIKYT